MLLYTLAGEEAAGRLSKATGIADGLGYVPARLCTPLDEESLSRSWTKMASAWICDPEQIEVMTVNDDRCVPIDAVDLERALSAPERPTERPCARCSQRQSRSAPTYFCLRASRPRCVCE